MGVVVVVTIAGEGERMQVVYPGGRWCSGIGGWCSGIGGFAINARSRACVVGRLK
jgi:hypothetical protein